jgi:hypothetical protein
MRRWMTRPQAVIIILIELSLVASLVIALRIIQSPAVDAKIGQIKTPTPSQLPATWTSEPAIPTAASVPTRTASFEPTLTLLPAETITPTGSSTPRPTPRITRVPTQGVQSPSRPDPPIATPTPRLNPTVTEIFVPAPTVTEAQIILPAPTITEIPAQADTDTPIPPVDTPVPIPATDTPLPVSP